MRCPEINHLIKSSLRFDRQGKSLRLLLSLLIIILLGYSCKPKRESDPVTTGPGGQYKISPTGQQAQLGLLQDSVLNAEKVYELLKEDDYDYSHLQEDEYLELLTGDSAMSILSSSPDPNCFPDKRPNGLMKRWPPKPGKAAVNWYMDEAHSGLEKAFEMVYGKDGKAENAHPVKIAHIDTGYDPTHPALFDRGKARFKLVNDINLLEPGQKAVDRKDGRKGVQELNYGHGTSTLSLITVNKAEIEGKEWRIGGNPNAEIEVFRAAYGSPLFYKNNSIDQAIKAFEIAIENQCDIISFSHGGTGIYIPKYARFTQVVKKACKKGIIVVAAAGNNYIKGGAKNIGWATKVLGNTVPIPAQARDYTIAVSAATYDLKPYVFEYYKLAVGTSTEGDCCMEHMQMSWKRNYMDIAGNIIAGFSPNIPVAKIDSGDFRPYGGGTSVAVPQVASAISLYIAKNREAYDRIPQNKKVGVIKEALFGSARKNIQGLSDDVVTLYFGNGILNAVEMLNAKYVPENIKVSPGLLTDTDLLIANDFGRLSQLFPAAAFERSVNQLVSKGEFNERQLGFLDYILYLHCLQDHTTQKLLDEYSVRNKSPEKQKELIGHLLESPELDKTSKSYIEKIQEGVTRN